MQEWRYTHVHRLPVCSHISSVPLFYVVIAVNLKNQCAFLVGECEALRDVLGQST